MRPTGFRAGRNRGFTLIELSIVLVIIGLLVAAIMVGKTLIRQAQVDSIITDYNKYQTATNQFKSKYSELPGDMADATTYWGANPNCATNGAGTGTQTCNGNGDQAIAYGPSNYYVDEMFWYWQQLGNAGMIDGQYTGVNNCDPTAWGAECIALNTNVPGSKVRGAGWSVRYQGVSSGDANLRDGNYNSNVLMFGSPSGIAGGPILTPQEALSIDTKVDDGLPGSGTVVSWKALMTPGCTTSDTNSSAQWNVANTGPLCSLVFKTNF